MDSKAYDSNDYYKDLENQLHAFVRCSLVIVFNENFNVGGSHDQ